jgi:hypothetical protein
MIRSLHVERPAPDDGFSILPSTDPGSIAQEAQFGAREYVRYVISLTIRPIFCWVDSDFASAAGAGKTLMS